MIQKLKMTRNKKIAGLQILRIPQRMKRLSGSFKEKELPGRSLIRHVVERQVERRDRAESEVFSYDCYQVSLK